MTVFVGTLTLHPRPRERWALERNGELRLNFGIGESRADAVRILASYGLLVLEDGKVWGPDPGPGFGAAPAAPSEPKQ